jgi:signal transduction histidine kinase
MKYADATETTVQLMADNKMLSVMVEDNGKGFDKTHLAINIRQRLVQYPLAFNYPQWTCRN